MVAARTAVVEQPRLERREVYFYGLVQGVGFRYSARQIAGDYRVAGFVRNLADGRVQLVIEGEADQLDRMLRELDRAMRGHIRETQMTCRPATGEFDVFRIAF